MTDPVQMLVTVTGKDRPGITSALLAALAGYDAAIVDVEQVVIRGRLVLGVLLRGPAGSDGRIRAALESALGPMGMEVEVSAGPPDDSSHRRGRSHVTVLGHPLRPIALGAIAGCIADYGGNIDRIVRIAQYPVTAVQLEVSGADPALLRSQLALTAAAAGVDVAVERSGLHRRAKRLVVLDVDSTLVQGEVIEMLAARAGCADEVAALTERAMHGDMEFTESLRARVRLLAGLDETALDDVRRDLQLARGARTFVRTLKRLDYRLAIVSGGFTQVTDALVADLGVDYSAANTLEIVDGRLTGELVGPVVDRAGKAAALERFAREAGVPMSATVAVGDGANDLDMLALAGLGIAYNAKPVVRDAADAALNVPYLDAILFLLGISREEVEEADEAEGLQVLAPPTSPS
ncbi:MAG: phosphoserine phosphatase SerB [Spirochaetaceae bacterium]|nr:phosphoserine phosphatase SerB [Spirochaetaceae bacterium]